MTRKRRAGRVAPRPAQKLIDRREIPSTISRASTDNARLSPPLSLPSPRSRAAYRRMGRARQPASVRYAGGSTGGAESPGAVKK